MIEEHRPSIFWVIRTDYLSNLAVLFPLVMWGIVAYENFQGVEIETNFLLISAGITVLSVGILLWRYLTILRVFNEGQSTSATIDQAAFFRGRGQITYIYTFRGEKYLGRSIVSTNSRTKQLKPGDRVTLFVDSNNPKKAYIREIYIK